MRLNSLIVTVNSKIIRDVVFKDGLNLIVNKSSELFKTGNSVGKSTLSRLIDYLFMSDGKDIHTDDEFKKIIPEIESLIINNSVVVTLNFTSYNNKPHQISRSLAMKASDSDFWVDNNEVDKNTYLKFISYSIFGLLSDKPSVRNLSHKFIRNTHTKMQKTLKVLFTKTSPDIYDELYLFLFNFQGLPLLKDKAKLRREINALTRDLTAYNKPNKQSVLKKLIKPLELDVKLIDEKINSFDFTDSHDICVDKLVEIHSEISDLVVKHSNISIKANQLKKSIRNINTSITDVNGQDLKDIYSGANVALSDGVVHSYKDMVLFHNKVISNKVKFLSGDLVKLDNELLKLNECINVLHNDESTLFKTIVEPDVLSSISQMYNKKTQHIEKIAEVKSTINKIQSTEEIKNNKENEQCSISERIEKSIINLDSNLELFNTFFSELTNVFYGERYVFDINFNSDKAKCDFDISSSSPNPTGGKKKGELTSFDFAYIKFIKSINLNRPSFIIHDSIEDVDVNQISDIFREASVLDGQYIVSVLSDKLSNSSLSSYLETSVILELSENDKFFKI